MREIAEISGVDPAQPFTAPERSVDESEIALDAAELQTMAELAQASLDSIRQSQGQSSSFEAEIGQLSSAMAVSKAQSSASHHKSSTRDSALDELEPLLEQLVPSVSDMDLILDGEIGPEWYIALERVRKPLDLPADSAKNADGSTPRAIDGAKQSRRVSLSRALERAKLQVVAKSRTLRRPGVDAQVVQREMLEAQPMFQLIGNQTPRLAAASAQAYRNTMKWYYTMSFGKYGRWLSRQPLATVDHPKSLGSAIAKSSFFSMGTSEAHNVDSYSVGARPTVLASACTPSLSAPPSPSPSQTQQVSPYAVSNSVPPSPSPSPALSSPSSVFLTRSVVVEERDTQEAADNGVLPMTAVPPASSPRYNLEILVCSASTVLGDSFEMEAQIEPLLPLQDSSFIDIFEPTSEFYANVSQTWISQCAGDLFGSLSCVRLAQKSPLNKWTPKWLDSTVLNKCWTLITSICHEQAQSIESAAHRVAASASANRQGPHILTQLLSSYFSGVSQMSPGEPEPKLERALQEIIEAYESFISKLASGDEQVSHNNYFVMAASLGDIPGSLAQGIAKHFQMSVDAYSQASK